MNLIMIVPCFNESKRWNTEYWTEATSLSGTNWIFVNDGSTDGTGSIIDTFCLSHPNTRALHLSENMGKAGAVRAGILNAYSQPALKPTGIGFVDADGAFDVNEIHRVANVFVAKVKSRSGIEAIWTARIALAGRNIKRTKFRHYVGRMIATVIGFNFPELPYDSQSGFKIFTATEELKDCFSSPFQTRWLFDIEILLRWRLQTKRSLKIWEEPLLAWKDVAGSKITFLQTAKIVHEINLINKLKKMSYQPKRVR